MSTYVMSDIHGQYYAYNKMLKKIHFSDDDFLYVLGDVIDRGPDGIKLIKDLMNRSNAEMLLGNHEFMLLNAVDYFKDRDAGDLKNEGEGMNAFELWTHPFNGGEGTCLEFLSMSEDEKDEICRYLRSLRLIKRIKVGSVNYHLSHSYSIDKPFGKEVPFYKLSNKAAENIVWTSIIDKKADISVSEKLFAYQRDVYIFGHIFTQRLDCTDEKGRGMIYRNKSYRGYNIIDVDCGMALNNKSSQLGCICLETGKDYYVPLLEE